MSAASSRSVAASEKRRRLDWRSASEASSRGSSAKGLHDYIRVESRAAARATVPLATDSRAVTTNATLNIETLVFIRETRVPVGTNHASCILSVDIIQ